MRTRTLLILIAVVAILAAGAWVVRAEDGAVMAWLTSLHGSPGGGH